MNTHARTLLNYAHCEKRKGYVKRKSLRWLKDQAHREARRNSMEEIRRHIFFPLEI